MDCKPKVRQVVELMLFLTALLFTGGCATSSSIIEDFVYGPCPLIYAGTRYHLEEIPLYGTRNRTHWASQLGYSFRWWHYVDLPLCLCADTLVLPYTVPRTYYTYLKSRPTKAEIAARPLIEEYATCIRNMRNLEADKVTYVQRHGLGASKELPQDIDFYRDQMTPYNKGPFYMCPADGEYRVGSQGEEPSCSTHGTLSEATKVLEFVCKEKRLPNSLPDLESTPQNTENNSIESDK